MRRILDQLLDTAHLQAGQPLNLELGSVDLTELAERVVDQHRQTTERHELRLSAPARGTVIGLWDATRVEQIVGNLVSNAIKSSPHGGLVAITVDCQAGLARLTVRDQGAGVPPAALAHLFEPFYRGGEQTADETALPIGGRGLGLFSAQRLARLHGGRIEVESKVGRGSAFTLILPLQKGQAPSGTSGGRT
jgi:signal transduction histidine kinase